MKKYIDADLLRKKITEEMDSVPREMGRGAGTIITSTGYGMMEAFQIMRSIIDSLQQDQPEVDLEKFTQKMDDWKARYNHPDNIPIKATMAFTARMFYMYPDVAMEWYAGLSKATQD